MNRSERQSVTAVIIGRAGSRGLPGKNSRVLNGRPMVHYSLDHALGAKTVDRVVVSTDCPEIQRAAGEYDTKKTVARASRPSPQEVSIISRPADLAGDTVTVDAAVRHAVEDDDSAIVVILYANVPVRPVGLIDRAVMRLIETGADSVQSYQPVGKYHPYWESSLDEDGRVVPYVENRVYRRQDLPPLFVPDGGVLALMRSSLFTVVPNEPHAFLGLDRRGVVSDGGVIDIDGPMDLVVAEAFLKSDCGK